MKSAKEFNITVYEGLTIDEISNSIGKPNKAVVGIKDKRLCTGDKQNN